MSCPNSQNPLILNVSMGALPEGFCPATYQELANAIAARIIIAPSEASLNIVGGSTEPASNVGPWFKNCEQLFVFNDQTGQYVPIEKGGFNEIQVISSSSDFIVPEGIFKVLMEGWGAGGGGNNFGGGGAGGGGGGGGYGLKILDVIPGQVITVTIGTGGTPSSPGTDTIFTTNAAVVMTCGGGTAGIIAAGAVGGSVTGADFGITGGSGSSANYGAGAMGGDSPRGGAGGYTGTTVAVNDGKLPGGGGVGGSSSTPTAGTGANGQAIIWF